MEISARTRSTWRIRAPTPWRERRHSCSRARKDAFSGTSMRHYAASIARQRPSENVTTAVRKSRSSGSTRFRTRGTASSASSAKKMESAKPNPPLFWGVLATVVALDVVTKVLAVANLSPQHIPHNVLGEHLRFTLVYNPGAAFGLNLGQYSRSEERRVGKECRSRWSPH